jgi:hypothetical protein
MFCTFTLVLSEVCVQYGCFLYFLILPFPVTLLMYFLNDFEIVLAAYIVTGVTFVFTFHMSCVSVVRSFFVF